MTQHSSSEQCFQKALDAENKGETKRAEQWLNLAVKREAQEKGGVPAVAKAA